MLTILDWSVSILTILYALLLMAYRYWFGKMKPFNEELALDHFIHFTIVIPARNEAANIKACIDSILAQDYPWMHLK